MELIEALRASPGLLAFSCALLGLCVGSFLNVVAWRLPVMMEHEFRNDAHEMYFEQYGAPPRVPDAERISLTRPASTCSSCKTPIRAWHNVPVLGWLFLKGRCASCGSPISVQYPLVEAFTGVLFVICAARFGWSPQLAGALVVTALLVAMTVIDLRTQFLPDELTLPLLWVGLGATVVPVFADPASAAVGAAAGYVSLWLVARVFEWVTRREKGSAMGEGDFKLLAGLGAWLGWQALPQVILLSALVGSVVGIGLMAARKAEWTSKIPFGPYIAGAGWLAMVYGTTINGAWLDLMATG
ncbi:MAG TPA: A24 family peptidase [Nevskiaceae bacterium]|nr:A24 family peptidase [Nevskiaceae bacterium]